MTPDSPRHRTRPDERGVVAPSRLVLVAVVVIAIAAAMYVATVPSGDEAAARPASATSPRASTSPGASSTPRATPSPSATAPAAKVVRGKVPVVVFNNSGRSGLAGRTASKVHNVGWRVVGSDNWYGTIPATTVYYPQRLQSAARVLARDLGITRVKPAVSPMRSDRLTVILTTDYR